MNYYWCLYRENTTEIWMNKKNMAKAGFESAPCKIYAFRTVRPKQSKLSIHSEHPSYHHGRANKQTKMQKVNLHDAEILFQRLLNGAL